MVFDSLVFVLFFALTLGLFLAVRSWTLRKGVLLAASYVFYGCWNPPFVLLLLLSTLIDFVLAQRIPRVSTRRGRRLLLGLCLGSNLGLLAAFKYGSFLLDGFGAALRGAGVDWTAPESSWVLPVGISFYTLQTISYTVDVYRGELRPTRRFVDYALYVSFFPQLVAGPIVRAGALLPQWRRPRAPRGADIGWGCSVLLFGLFLKVVVADGLAAPVADAVYGAEGPPRPFHAWLGILAFGVQIFGDFGGYSLCAIGAARCFGIHLPPNFRCPFSSVGFREFWRRWHVSLSTWLRDYVYVPLGGSRRGGVVRTGALLLTMMAAGLWHGAAWKFVAWGLLHGLVLCVESAFAARRGSEDTWLPRWLGAPLTFAAFSVSLLLVRAEDCAHAGALALSLCGLGPAGSDVLLSGRLLTPALAAAVIACHLAFRDRRLEDLAARLSPASTSTMLATLMVLISVVHGVRRDFFYFQF